jgi:hypothetical protein
MYRLVHQPQAAIGAVSGTRLHDLKYTSGSLVSVAVGWTIHNRAPRDWTALLTTNLKPAQHVGQCPASET